MFAEGFGMGKTVFENLPGERLLALCVYGEARGEPIEGKIGVANVVMNRVQRGKAEELRTGRKYWWGTTIHEVILKPQQFSCFNAGDPNRLKLMAIAADWDRYYQRDKALRECAMVAENVIGGRFPDNTKGATHYKTINCKAAWAASMELVAEIGSHQFFCEKA
jgi:N-acetylmuramoyl-L-alanine amidase